MAVQAKFKYTLNHHISYQPKWVTLERLSKQLAKYGISRRTFERDKYIKIGQASDIPGERLMIYAKFFEVPLPQLFNYDLKVKPIDRKDPSARIKKVIDRTGLKFPSK